MALGIGGGTGWFEPDPRGRAPDEPAVSSPISAIDSGPEPRKSSEPFCASDDDDDDNDDAIAARSFSASSYLPALRYAATKSASAPRVKRFGSPGGAVARRRCTSSIFPAAVAFRAAGAKSAYHL